MNQLAEQVQALDHANFALQEAHRRLLTEREQERKHLARELHDQVIQDLLSVNYQLEDIQSEEGDKLEVNKELEQVREDIPDMVEELRRLCSNLRPLTIDSLGLGCGPTILRPGVVKRSGIGLTLELDPNLGRLPIEIEAHFPHDRGGD